jgi:hypothetical protein
MEKQIILTEYSDLLTIDKGRLETAFKAGDGLSELMKRAKEKIESEKDKLPDDMSKAGNRAKLKSLAALVLGGKKGSLRKWIDDNGKALLASKKSAIEEQQKEIRLISSSKKSALEACKDLHAETVAPAAEWEEKEKIRISDLKSGIADIKEHGEKEGSVEELKFELSIVEQQTAEGYQEFQKEAQSAKDAAIKSLQTKIELAELKEAESARLAEEEKKRIQKEADDRAAKKLEQDRINAAAEKQRAKEDQERTIKARVQEIINLGIGVEALSLDGIDYRLEALGKIGLLDANFKQHLLAAIDAHDEVYQKLLDAEKAAIAREKAEAEAKAAQDKIDQEERDKKAKTKAEADAAEALRLQKAKEKAEADRRRNDKERVSKINTEISEAMQGKGYSAKEAAKLIFHIRSCHFPKMFIED